MDETTPAPAPKRVRSSQDLALANRINTYRTAITSAQAHAELVALLTPRGYDVAGLAEGLKVCDAAQAAFNARQEAQAAQSRAATTARAADKAARSGYDGFRKIARAMFKTNDAAKTALNLAGRVPDDQEKFLTVAAAVYDAALKHGDYLTALSKRGYNQAALEAEQARLAALTQASAAHETAQAVAQRATVERDAAAKTLDAWWAEFRAVAQVVLKDRPDLIGLLEL